MRSASERFVLAMVRACMSRTGSGIRFDYGSLYMAQSHEDGGPGARAGVMSIKIHQVEPLIRVEYSIIGMDDSDTWAEGRCTISLSNEPDRKWEFYCQRQDNGLLRARTMSIMRQCRVLKKAVHSALIDLGNNSEAIAHQLQKMGYPPDIKGLKLLIGDVFALADVEILYVTSYGRSYLEIRGHRVGNPDLELRIFNPGGTIGAAATFIAQQLNSTC